MIVLVPVLQYYEHYMRPSDITRRITNMIESFDHTVTPDKIAEPFGSTIAGLERDYIELIRLSQQRERYNPSWAFSFAHEKLQHELSHIFTTQVKDEILGHAEAHKNRERKDIILTKFSVIEQHLTTKIMKTANYSRTFKTATFLISAAEILLTFLIVIIVTEVSRAINKAVSIPQMSFIFIGVFGLMRLFLEKGKNRFLYTWRWNMYLDTVDTAYHGLITMTATTCMLAFYMKRGTFLEDIDDLLEKSLNELSRRPSKEEKARRRASHQVARKKMETNERINILTQRLDTKTVHAIMGMKRAETTLKKPSVPYKALFGKIKRSFFRNQ